MHSTLHLYGCSALSFCYCGAPVSLYEFYHWFIFQLTLFFPTDTIYIRALAFLLFCFACFCSIHYIFRRNWNHEKLPSSRVSLLFHNILLILERNNTYEIIHTKSCTIVHNLIQSIDQHQIRHITCNFQPLNLFNSSFTKKYLHWKCKWIKIDDITPFYTFHYMRTSVIGVRF